MLLYYARWLPGFARVPYYAPSPCHMHTVHNCHHIKSFHPPVKQYITTHHNTEFKYYTCSLFFISNTKVSRARAALWVVLCNVDCILASVLVRVHPSKFPSLPISLPPSLLSLAPFLPPSSARFLTPHFPSLLPCLSSFLTRSLPQPFLHSRSHPPSHHSFLTPSPCSLPPPPSPSSLPHILHPSLSGRLPPSNSIYTVLASCTVLCSAQPGVALRQSVFAPEEGVVSMARCYVQRTCSHHESVFDEE